MKLGLIINPLAGIGGSVALKGSDGADIVDQALARGAKPLAGLRTLSALRMLDGTRIPPVKTASGEMGEHVLKQADVRCEVVYHLKADSRSSSQDTRDAVIALLASGIELLVFAGGDGTARDVLDALSAMNRTELLVVGIPAGCKIHSAVYAVTPMQAGELIALIAAGTPMSLHEVEVMDLDENAFRAGEVKASCYGYLRVPVDDTRMQVMKQGGVDREAIAQQEIATDIVDNMQDDVCYFVGSGTTTAAIMEELGLENTLLGVDAVINRKLVAADIDAATMLDIASRHPAKIIVTAIGGQGHVFGRGNQQFSPDVIRTIIDQGQRDNIIIVASIEKLRTLEGRPLRVDTGDAALDVELAGMVEVITGYGQRTLYRMGN